jgi:hypothetical protein
MPTEVSRLLQLSVFYKVAKKLSENISICTIYPLFNAILPCYRNLINHKLTSQSAHFESRSGKASRGWTVSCFLEYLQANARIPPCLYQDQFIQNAVQLLMMFDSTRRNGVYHEIMSANIKEIYRTDWMKSPQTRNMTYDLNKTEWNVRIWFRAGTVTQKVWNQCCCCTGSVLGGNGILDSDDYAFYYRISSQQNFWYKRN